MLQNQLAQRRRRRAYRGSIYTDAIERPVGVTPMADVMNSYMAVCLPLPPRTQVRGDTLAFANISLRPLSRTSTPARAKRRGTL